MRNNASVLKVHRYVLKYLPNKTPNDLNKTNVIAMLHPLNLNHAGEPKARFPFPLASRAAIAPDPFLCVQNLIFLPLRRQWRLDPTDNGRFPLQFRCHSRLPRRRKFGTPENVSEVRTTFATCDEFLLSCFGGTLHIMTIFSVWVTGMSQKQQSTFLLL